jgi:hypothetical protein
VSRRSLALLAAAVVLRMAFHAVYLPAFEGPDEPQHLARIWDFARKPWPEAFSGREVGVEILETVRRYPCRAELHATIGCPEYRTNSGAFDLLRPVPEAPPGAPLRPIPNVEGNQPPLFYALAGAVLRFLPVGVAGALLFARLLAAALVALALFGPLRGLSRRFPPGVAEAGLLALLLPGASEGLARCSNEASTFLWASLVLAALDRPTPAAALIALLAAGPMLKLTAIPVVVLAAIVLGRERSRGVALGSVAASLLVFPLQAARGWMWGGTLELNFPGSPVTESPLRIAAGFARSAYAFVKTAFWIGGHSLVRPPRWLTAAYGAWCAGLLLAFRRRNAMRRVPAHAGAALVAAAGFAVFAVANRRYYGDWGGVGGWYLWGWSPWLATAVSDLGGFTERSMRPLLVAGALLAVVANAVWFDLTWAAYGG